MKKLVLLLSVACFPLLLLAQFEPPPSAPYIRYGDFYYRNNYGGLKQLMRALPKHDPELHGKLRPEWEEMQTNQGLGIALCTFGAVSGFAIMLTVPDYDTGSAVEDVDRSVGRIAFGTLILAGGLSGGLALLNLRRDILSFVNTFNARSEGAKLKFTLTTAAGPGVGLQYRLD